ALVDGHSFWGRQRPDQVVNPRIDKLVESFLRLPPPGELLRRHARLLCKRSAEEQEVDHRVLIAAPQTRSDRSVLRFHPFGPTAGALLRRFALQFGGENFIERLQHWSRLFICEEAGLRLWRRSDGDGARQGDKAEKKTSGH